MLEGVFVQSCNQLMKIFELKHPGVIFVLKLCYAKLTNSNLFLLLRTEHSYSLVPNDIK